MIQNSFTGCAFTQRENKVLKQWKSGSSEETQLAAPT